MRMTLRMTTMLALLLAAVAVQAQTRAWLDRDRIALGETTTLNIETEQLTGVPDYTPLLRDFSLSGHSSRRQVETGNGQTRTRTLYAVALRPSRDGVIGIPALRVRDQFTPPLTLTVAPNTATRARTDGDAFIESEVDDPGPYVQQPVRFSVRLHSAIPLISGQLDQATPEGATLQRVGDDLQYSREIGGRRYFVLERRYLLIAERSGTLTIPGARFRGHGVGDLFDELLGNRRRELDTTAPARTMQVRAAPANAPQPWLPLHDLRMRYTATPQQARAGEAATVVIEAIADGASAAQLPELQLAAGDGAQVFPEPARIDESFDAGRPHVTVTRRFSIVPARAGNLRLTAPRLAWWDVNAGAARTATLPALSLRVAPGEGNFAAPPTPATGVASADDGRIRVPGVQGRILPWALATVLFAVLWFVTLWWGLHRQPHATTTPAAAAPPATSGAQAHFKRVLEAGDLGEIADSLCAMASPPVHSLDELREHLDSEPQRTAIDTLQRARWAGGDAVAARMDVRAAFKRGPQWRQSAPSKPELLPPLYPPA